MSDAPSATDAEGGQWLAMRIGRSRYETRGEARRHEIVMDEPATVGGSDRGPTPYEHLLGALAGCSAITLRMYADRKGWPLESVVVRLRTAPARSHEADCEACETTAVGPHRLEREIDLVGPLSAEQRRRLLAIADRCPVKQTLERGVEIVEATAGGPALEPPTIDAGDGARR